MDWRKKIISEAFSGIDIPQKNKPETTPPSVVPVEATDTQLETLKKNLIDGLKEEVLKEIKDGKMLSAMDLKDGPSIVYPNKKVQDLRWHGAGVTKIIAGTNITISSTGEIPGLSDVTINAINTGSSGISNETPSGVVNGINTVFTTAFVFVLGTTRLYRNGLRQQLGGDYTETGAQEITFTSAPLTGDILVIDYDV